MRVLQNQREFFRIVVFIYLVRFGVWNLIFLIFLVKQMEDGSEDYSQTPLKEILENEDLQLEQILAIPNIHTKIKINMKIFIQYCLHHLNFTHKFINMGLKCPMHQSNNQQMKQFTYIAADVLTSDHETLADLFIIQPKKHHHQGQDQIQEEIQTEEFVDVAPQKKYMFLNSLFQYLNGAELDQNCVNYIAKTLATLVRKKISQFLEFFIENPQLLHKLIEISNFPSIAHLLAKMLTDDDESLTDRAISIKQRIIPLLMERIHKNIHKAETIDAFQGIQDILNSTRYADQEERNALQKMSDQMVGQQQINFFVKCLYRALEEGEKTVQLFNVLQNSVTYLSLILARLNMDEHHDFTYSNQPQDQAFNPTLKYQIDDLFHQFCIIIINVHRIWQYRDVVGSRFGILPVKVIDPLIIMTKHSRFSIFYEKISRSERTLALQTLLRILCTVTLNGVLLQTMTSLLEKMLTQQQNLAEREDTQIVLPDDLYISISEYAGSIGGSIASLLEQTKKQRNCNEKGIHYRKILLLLDNYFKNKHVQKRYPNTAKLQKIFPSFNIHNNKLYAQKTQVLDHPGGDKRKQVEQCKFIGVNRDIMKSSSPELETYHKEKLEQEKKQIQVEEEVPKQKTKKQIIMNLPKRFADRQQQVKQPDTDKGQVKPIQNMNSPTNKQEIPPSQNLPPLQETQSQQNLQQSPKKKQNPKETVPKKSPSKTENLQNEESGQNQCRSREPTGLTFFVRHLMIY